jgi:penicillin-binding protein 2
MIQPKLVQSINANPVQAGVLDIPNLDINNDYWDYVHRAMRDVVHSAKGTAKGISAGLDYEIAGKTGTAQVISIDAEEEYDSSKIEKNKWDHALFVAFAPVDDPQIAVGLIVENGEHGSSAAAPIARQVIETYMKSRPPGDGQLMAAESPLQGELR